VIARYDPYVVPGSGHAVQDVLQLGDRHAVLSPKMIQTASGQFPCFANRPDTVRTIAGCQRPIAVAVFPELVALCMSSR
jgi:hypothetical protein